MSNLICKRCDGQGCVPEERNFGFDASCMVECPSCNGKGEHETLTWAEMGQKVDEINEMKDEWRRFNSRTNLMHFMTDNELRKIEEKHNAQKTN